MSSNHRRKPSSALRPAYRMPRPQEPVAFADPLALFDTTHARLLSGDPVAPIIDTLSDALWWFRTDLPADGWTDVTKTARLHPLTGLLHENPLLRRSFVKPRGYDGDAGLLDIIHDGAAATDLGTLSPIGRALLERDLCTPFAAAVRERSAILGSVIDDVAGTTPHPAVLVAGCGHLWEAASSRAMRRNRIGRLVALDEDKAALDRVARDHAGKPLTIANNWGTAVMDRTFDEQSFDLIYVPTLYERMQDRFANGLTRALFDLLRPGGRLVACNMARGQCDAGYLEAFGDWFLNMRDAAAMQRLADSLPAARTAFARVYTCGSPDIFYLEIRKRHFPARGRPLSA